MQHLKTIHALNQIIREFFRALVQFFRVPLRFSKSPIRIGLSESNVTLYFSHTLGDEQTHENGYFNESIP